MSGVRRRAHVQANLTQKDSRVANCRNFQSRMGLFRSTWITLWEVAAGNNRI